MSETEKEIQIPVDWHIPDDFPSAYASNMFAQAGEYDITFSFFQTKLPLLTGTPEDNRAKLEEIGMIKAECVSQVIVNPDLVPKIIKALQKTYDGYLATKKMLEEEQNEYE